EAELARGRAAEAAGALAAAERSYWRAGEAGDASAYERLVRLELAAGRASAASQALRALVSMKSARPADLVLVAQVQAATGTRQGRDAALQTLLRCARQ